MSGEVPKCVLLVSGKRKCGKDFFTDQLLESVGSTQTIIIKISAPIKSHFAKTYNLSLTDLMSSNEYKEKYRTEMIIWSDSKRLEDPGVFCASAVDMYKAHLKPIWIVSDIRRKTDIAWFKEKYGTAVKTMRIDADNNVRITRGWSFTQGVDDVTSECDLDDYTSWDWVLDNNGTVTQFKHILSQIANYINSVLFIKQDS